MRDVQEPVSRTSLMKACVAPDRGEVKTLLRGEVLLASLESYGVCHVSSHKKSSPGRRR